MESLLDRKDEANFDWNKLEICQQRITKKIAFMTDFIKDKQDLLKEKKVMLEKAEIQLEDLQGLVKNNVKELKGTHFSP